MQIYPWRAVVSVLSTCVIFLKILMIGFQISSQFLLKDVRKTVFLGTCISSLKVLLKSVIVIVIFAEVYTDKTVATY